MILHEVVGGNQGAFISVAHMVKATVALVGGPGFEPGKLMFRGEGSPIIAMLQKRVVTYMMEFLANHCVEECRRKEKRGGSQAGSHEAFPTFSQHLRNDVRNSRKMKL